MDGDLAGSFPPGVFLGEGDSALSIVGFTDTGPVIFFDDPAFGEAQDVQTFIFEWHILRSKGPHESNEVRLFLGVEFQLQDEVEELDRVFQGEASAVVQVRWTVFDSAEGKGLNRSER